MGRRGLGGSRGGGGGPNRKGRTRHRETGKDGKRSLVTEAPAGTGLLATKPQPPPTKPPPPPEGRLSNGSVVAPGAQREEEGNVPKARFGGGPVAGRPR